MIMSQVVEQRVSTAVAARRHVTPTFPDCPSHVGVYPLGESVGQLGVQPRGDPRRVVRRRCYQSEDDLRALSSTVIHHRFLIVGRSSAWQRRCPTRTDKPRVYP
jgi:hypothetical protein